MEVDHNYSCSSASVCQNEPSPEHLQDLDMVIREFMIEQDIPGAALAIRWNGKLVYQQGYGMAGVGRRALSTTVFRIASISKTVTAIGILRLCQEGKLDLDSKVFGPRGMLSEYRPRCKRDKRLLRVTVRNLLEHSSGWDRDRSGDPVFWRLEKVCKTMDPNSNEALLNFMMTKKLDFTPGKRYAYSNFGFLVLGMVMERVLEIPYEDYMCGLLREIGIHRMKIGCTKKIDCDEGEEAQYFNNRQPLVQKSIFAGEGLVLPQYGGFAMETTGAYGGWVASAIDLLHLLDSLPNDSLIDNTTFSMMLKKPLYEHGHNWYGLGIDVQDSGATWGHTGEMDGTSASFQHHRSGFSWTLLFNSWSHDSDLDGLVKYALSTVSIWPLWQRSHGILPNQAFEIVSDDNYQFVSMMLPHENLIEHIKVMRSQNYKMTWLNSLIHKDKTVFSIVWHKMPLCSKHFDLQLILVDLKKNEANAKIKNAATRGLFIILLECYVIESVPNFLIVFEKITDIIDQKVFLLEDLASPHYLQLLNEYKNSYYKLSIQCVTVVCNFRNLFVSAIFNKLVISTQNDTVSWIQITIENFQYEMSQLALKSFELIYMQFYNDKDDASVSAIWSCKSEGCAPCLQRNGVSRFGFLYELQESSKKKLPLVFVSSYYSDNVLNFAAVWGSKQWQI